MPPHLPTAGRVRGEMENKGQREGASPSYSDDLFADDVLPVTLLGLASGLEGTPGDVVFIIST